MGDRLEIARAVGGLVALSVFLQEIYSPPKELVLQTPKYTTSVTFGLTILQIYTCRHFNIRVILRLRSA